ncbi:hypothetical protein [Paraburkholderia sp. DGU8]|uniref:hypothetical protein n=1 Tax=Paraburkholderia sp. DGU8 TaxID=3161997 RepID=UPI003467D63F
MKPHGAKNVRSRGMWQVPPFASKLTRRHRDAARADHAYAQALREQTLYPQRVDALIAGQTHYTGKLCERCASVKRRVYDNSCWACQRGRTHFAVDSRNRCVTVWQGKNSRAGYEARLSEKRREAVGECWAFEVGDFRARVYPTGRLAVDCDRLSIHCADWATVPVSRVFEIGNREPALVEVMRRAGWSV